MTSLDNPQGSMAGEGRTEKPQGELRRGWTTGACATAATKAALTALLTGEFPDPVTITLPKGEMPAFPLAFESAGESYASAGIVKDAGDDPDVTHGATIIATVCLGEAGTGVTFARGEGVGMVTRPGLPIGVGEPAINPVPRAMMRAVAEEICAAAGIAPDIEITISVPGGDKIAERTWNPRLGIVGGISILGTTGIVVPFSCSAWIHSIHRGIDVSRAAGVTHVLGATGTTSEDAARALYGFPEHALLDMGDFAGGLLKYLRDHPIPRLTLAGGFAKFAKLAKGALDLHSGRSQVDMDWLAAEALAAGASQDTADKISTANSALDALVIAGEGSALPQRIADGARRTALETLRGAPVQVEVLVVSRDGVILARAGKFDDAG
jgi:cobalt-precorrin-5B (C1)-methyltransferase